MIECKAAVYKIEAMSDRSESSYPGTCEGASVVRHGAPAIPIEGARDVQGM